MSFFRAVLIGLFGCAALCAGVLCFFLPFVGANETNQRFRAPDGQLVLRVETRSGGGAAGFVEKRFYLETTSGTKRHTLIATVDPADAVIEQRWTASNRLVIELDSTDLDDDDPFPTSASLGARTVAITTIDYGRCKHRTVDHAGDIDLDVRLLRATCPSGASELVVQARRPNADPAGFDFNWTTLARAPTIGTDDVQLWLIGSRIDILHARRRYPRQPTEQGVLEGSTPTVHWIGP